MCMAMIVTLSAPYAGVWEAADNGLADQESVIGSYLDGTGNLQQMDRGFSSNMFLYPSPEKQAIGNPTSHTFLNICLMHYSSHHKKSMNYGLSDIPLDDNFFESLRRTLENARHNGVTVGIRFQYDTDGVAQAEPDWDNMMYNLEQIRDSGILDEYADCIEWCEVGTLGAFGEQHSSRYGNQQYSTELIDIYLQMFRSDIPLLLRTSGRIMAWVNAKLGTNYTTSTIQNMVGEVNTLYSSAVNNTGNYYSGDGKNYSTGNYIKDDLARLGMYNDGYMGTLIDYGTFGNRANETKFLNDQTKVVYGGEFSGDRYMQIEDGSRTNTVWYPVNAIPEMYYTNLWYLHGGPWSETNCTKTFSTEAGAANFVARLEALYDDIGATWLKGTATVSEKTVTYIAPGYNTLPFTSTIEEAVRAKIGVDVDLSDYYGVNTQKFIMDHLGYRFVVRSSRMTGYEIQPGDSLDIELAIENTGFHKINKSKEVEILVVNGKSCYSMKLSGVDVRKWDTGTNHISTRISLPDHISGGTWQVYLRISAENESASDNTKWCVQFANDNIFNSTYGANLIGEIEVDAPVVEVGEFVDTRMTGEYYDEPITYSADYAYLPFVEHGYEFKQSGLYGFTLIFKLDGLSNSDGINLTRWETNGSGSQLHAFNYFFQRDKYQDESGKPAYQYGVQLYDNGYYIMYNPFYSVSLNTTVSNLSVAGKTSVQYLYCNATGTNREDKNTPTDLRGNAATITPLGIVEGAVTGYDVTFHYNGTKHYTGSYGLKNTDKVVSENCQFKAVQRVLDLYDGEIPSSYTDGALAYRFVGWTTQEGYKQGIVSEDQIAAGVLDLYPYYEIDMSASALNAYVETLTDESMGNYYIARDSHGIIYTYNRRTRTATVGVDNGWDNNAGFGTEDTNAYVIPAYVIINDVYYKVTGIESLAFAYCAKLSEIVIPDTVTSIKTDSFMGDDSLVIRTYSGSDVATYADENGITLDVCSDRNRFAVVYIDTNTAKEDIVDIKSVDAGNTVTSDVTLSRESDETCCHYEFVGFDTDGVAIMEDSVAHPVFNSADHVRSEQIVVTPATCTATGSYKVECTLCGAQLESGEIPMLEHTPGDETVIKKATCAETGISVVTCTVCGEELSRNTIEMTAHIPGAAEIEKDATCTEDGLSVIKCMVCYKVIDSSVIPEKGHTAGEVVVIQDGGCTQDRILVQYCSVCNAELNRTVTPGSHKFTDYVSNNDATCTHDGTKTAVCDTCHETVDTVTDEGSMRAHTSDTYTVTQVAPEGGSGTKTAVCEECGNKFTAMFTVDLYGDANGDGEVNATDISIMSRYLAGADIGEVKLEALDVHDTKAGPLKPNQADLTKLIRFVAGWQGYNKLGPIN